MALPEISGIIGACLTPFKDGGGIDFDALQQEIDFIVADADGISIGAVEAAEYTMLSIDERKELLRIGTEMVDGRVPVLAGTSHPSPKVVLDMAEYAATVGADYAQVLMPLRPWGGEPTMAELIDYFTFVASQSPLPIVAAKGMTVAPPASSSRIAVTMSSLVYAMTWNPSWTSVAAASMSPTLSGIRVSRSPMTSSFTNSLNPASRPSRA